MASIKEVARVANVSLSTVSKVLNERADAQISAGTRERVRAAARHVGYHPNAIARGLSKKRMETVGVIMAYHEVSVTSDSYLGPCLDGILRVNKLRRQKTLLFTEHNWSDAVEQIPSYCDGHCDGLLLVIPRLDSFIVNALLERTIPFVLVGDSRDAPPLATVDLDNAEAARLATQHLLDLGHRRIAAFLGFPDFCSSTQRLGGYRAALESAGLWEQAERESWVRTCGYNPEAARNAVYELLENFPDPATRPTALVCFSDSIALGTLEALRERGVRVPEDISVIGIDDVPAARYSQPPLTTIRHDVRAVGAAAAQTLLDLIDKKIAGQHQEWVAPQLVVRQSTVPPSKERSLHQP